MVMAEERVKGGFTSWSVRKETLSAANEAAKSACCTRKNAERAPGFPASTPPLDHNLLVEMPAWLIAHFRL